MGKLLKLFGAESFTPTTFGNLRLWLDASDYGSLIKDGGNRISQWSDKSGNGNHALQAGGSLQPLYVNSAINAKPSVQFRDDGTAKLLSVADAASLDYTAYSMFTVMRRHTDVGVEIALGKWSESSPSNQREFRLLINANDTLTLSCSISGTSTSASPTTADSLPINTNCIIDSVYDGTNVKVAINNGTQASAGLASIFNGASPFHIGSRDGGSSAAGIHIGEIIFYRASLTGAQRLDILNYLSTKWGIAIA